MDSYRQETNSRKKVYENSVKAQQIIKDREANSKTIFEKQTDIANDENAGRYRDMTLSRKESDDELSKHRYYGAERDDHSHLDK